MQYENIEYEKRRQGLCDLEPAGQVECPFTRSSA